MSVTARGGRRCARRRRRRLRGSRGTEERAGLAVNSPSAVSACTAARAPAKRLRVGRMTEQSGRLFEMNSQGSGMMRLVVNCSPPKGGAFRSGNRVPVTGSTTPASVVGDGVAGLVVPDREVVDLGAADADDDPQHLEARGLRAQRGVEARAALLDHREVEAGRVRDRLHPPRVAARGRHRLRAYPAACRRRRAGSPAGADVDRLREGRAEVGVTRAPVARVPAGVDVQAHEVREPPRLSWHPSPCCSGACGTRRGRPDRHPWTRGTR